MATVCFLFKVARTYLYACWLCFCQLRVSEWKVQPISMIVGILDSSCTRSQITWRDFFFQISIILIEQCCSCYTGVWTPSKLDMSELMDHKPNETVNVSVTYWPWDPSPILHRKLCLFCTLWEVKQITKTTVILLFAACAIRSVFITLVKNYSQRTALLDVLTILPLLVLVLWKGKESRDLTVHENTLYHPLF